MKQIDITEMLQYWNSKNNMKRTGEIDVAIEKKDRTQGICPLERIHPVQPGIC